MIHMRVSGCVVWPSLPDKYTYHDKPRDVRAEYQANAHSASRDRIGWEIAHMMGWGPQPDISI